MRRAAVNGVRPRGSSRVSSNLSRNHFDLLGLPVRYALDAAALERRYRDLQSRVHPDKFAAAGEAERRRPTEHGPRLSYTESPAVNDSK